MELCQQGSKTGKRKGFQSPASHKVKCQGEVVKRREHKQEVKGRNKRHQEVEGGGMNGGLKQTRHKKGPWRECQESSCNEHKYEKHLEGSDRGRMLFHLQNVFFKLLIDPNISASQHAFVAKHTQAKKMVKKESLGLVFVLSFLFELIISDPWYFATTRFSTEFSNRLHYVPEGPNPTDDPVSLFFLQMKMCIRNPKKWF